MSCKMVVKCTGVVGGVCDHKPITECLIQVYIGGHTPLERLSTSRLLLLCTDKQPATYSKSHKPRKAGVQVCMEAT